LRISHVCKFAIAMLAVALFASPLLYANSTHSGESGRFALITGGFSAYGITDLLPKGELTGKAGVPHPSAAFFGFGESRGVWGSNLAWGAAFESDRNFSHVDFGNPGHHRGTFFPPSSGTGPGAPAASGTPAAVPEPDSALLLVLGLGAAALATFALAKK